MAISFDNSNQASSSGSVNSLTWTQNIAGDFIFVMFGENTGTPTQTGVTVGGVAMTRITGAQAFASTWYRASPPTGTSVSIVATRSTTSTAVIRGISASYNNMATSGNPTATVEVTGSNSASTTISISTANSWLVTFGSSDNGGTIANGTNATLRKANTGDPSFGIFDSNGTVSTGTSTVGIALTGATANVGLVSAALAPVAVINSGLLTFF